MFGHGQGGKREVVHPGNQRIRHAATASSGPQGGGGGGGGSGQASDSGEGEDDFVFHLTKEEFMQVFFDDLALPQPDPHAARRDRPSGSRTAPASSTTARPTNLHVVRSMRGALGRRIALGADSRARAARGRGAARALLEEQGADDAARSSTRPTLLEQIEAAAGAASSACPSSTRSTCATATACACRCRPRKAVMFCLMDVSGSMDESRKDLAKRFFILLYLFLTRHYEKIEVVFIRHHTQAPEVDEQNFFHATETGGTVVSSALVLMDEIIRARYPSSEWNIYGAQASDGDNWHHDSGRCRELLDDKILPLVPLLRLRAGGRGRAEPVGGIPRSVRRGSRTSRCARSIEASQIYPVFRDLFKKEGAHGRMTHAREPSRRRPQRERRRIRWPTPHGRHRARCR